MKHKLRFIVFALIVLFMINHSLFIIPAYAVDAGKAQITPASPLYFLKSVREILELKFAGTIRTRALRELEFATRRIREVKSLAKTSREELIEPTLERYVSNLQEVKGKVHPNDKEMVIILNENLTTQMNVLQEVFGQVSDPKAKRSIRLAVFRISEQFKSPTASACSFLKKEASSSALNEIGKMVYLERAQKCLINL